VPYGTGLRRGSLVDAGTALCALVTSSKLRRGAWDHEPTSEPLEHDSAARGEESRQEQSERHSGRYLRTNGILSFTILDSLQ